MIALSAHTLSNMWLKGMSDKSLEYPLAYGYSLVGRVVACGSNVYDADELMGRLVFTFSPHSSRVVVDRDAIQVVPDGISAEDAVFFPSVETALSLVHDARVRMGENVAVYGQGLIGLLVTSILSMQSLPLTSSADCFGSVTAFDALDARLVVSSSLGASSALKPDLAAAAGPFDCSIEVSGNPRALQSAIDHTSNNGRIVVGSWYGNTDVVLKLGIDFHRSNKEIVASQVSKISPTLAGLWSKTRRFSFTWALVKSLRPSRLIAKRLPLYEAQQAYELLDKGEELVICFKYE
ncbi:hypothetical protein ACHAW5_002642 [Stephanodiscus triporus]|uniref:Uncharacterized protein n=1 Tax=Stephanodiscus triporus TaxID=2934178 RepID=A0ABD3MHN6_9STRA